MKRNEVIILVVVVLVAAVILFLVNRGNREEHFNWYEVNSINSDEPYGNSLFYNLMDDYFPNNKVSTVSADLSYSLNKAKQSREHTNYLFLGNNIYLTDETFESLSSFVYSGNDAFILASTPGSLLTKIYYMKLNASDEEEDVEEDTAFQEIPIVDNNPFSDEEEWTSFLTKSNTTCNFTAKGFRTTSGYHYTFYDKDLQAEKRWSYFLPDYLQSSADPDILGTVQTAYMTNYIRIPHGAGYFYIHLEPVLFSNFYLLDENKLEYANKAMSYMKPGDIIWDEYSQTFKRNRNNDNQDEGPLRFVLSNAALRSAWYTMLGGLVLFLLFRTKRQQKPIPVLEPNENRSLEFVQTIGRMYYIRGDHKQLAHQKIKLFYHFIQNRYQIPTAQIDDDFKTKLQLKSEISLSTINEILKHADYIDRTNEVTNQDILLLHQLIDNFYKHCK